MLEYWRSTIGKKQIVALTGAILIGYLILHMLGNLNSAFGPGADQARVDWYSHWLRDFGEPLLPHAFILWAVRVVLLGAILTHITGIAQLVKRNREARPANFPAKRIGRSVESVAMLGTGVLLVAFIIFHILQFTTLSIHVTPVAEGDVYANLYYAFQKWYFVAIYLGALLFIGMHLRHGVWSFFQTLGLDSPSRNAKLRHGSTALVVILVVGFGSIPVLFFTDVLDPPRTEAVLTTLAGVPL